MWYTIMISTCPSGVMDACPNALADQSGALFLTLINTLFLTKCSLNPESLYQTNYGPELENNDEFDFIVVGAGSAGSAVANRLTENENWNVLVIEAGGYPTSDSEIPALFLSQQLTSVDWQYATEPSDTSCKGFTEGRCRWPRGKILGGSSSLNAMLYHRGNSRDYDTWESAGNTGWGWKHVLHYFIKSENTTLEGEKRHLHGTEGYLKTSHVPSANVYRDVLLNAAREASAKVDSAEDIGMLESLNTIDNGRRFSAAKAYLASVKTRNNLRVALNSFVTRILIREDLAYGVEVNINGRLINILARNEVIVSGGAINSPQILMLSGIGPRQHLRQLGISVIKHAPVGENLQDHVLAFGIVARTDPALSHERSPIDQLGDVYTYFTNNSGPLAGIDVTNIVWFFNTKNNSQFPNVQTYFLSSLKNGNYLLPEVLNKVQVNEVTAKQLLEENKESDLLLILPCVLNPRSRGKILLRSTNPFVKPLIYANYLSDKKGEDIQTLLESIAWIEKLLQTPSFKKYKAELLHVKIPGCEELKFRSEEYWRCSFQHLGTTIYHPTGTCKMGSNPRTSVVDARLRVHGVNSLRVVDASIMPNVISGGTNVPSIMIGEKGADMIKEDWGIPV